MADNFVDDLLDLPFPKRTFVTRKDIPADKKLTAEEWGRVCQASLDMREKIIALLETVAPSSSQRFMVTIQDDDTDEILVDASRGFIARGDTNFLVHATMGKNTSNVGIVGCDPDDYTTSHFKIRLTSTPATDDTINITVEELT